MSFIKNIKELKEKYAFKYLEAFGSFSTPISFNIFDEKLFLLNFGYRNKFSGNLKIYNLKNNELLDTYKLNENPIVVEKFENRKLIIVKHLKQGIFLFDLKTGKEELFIKGEKFLKPTSILIDNEKIYITDVFQHRIKIFTKQGILIKEIDLRGKAEFPNVIRKIKDKFMFLTLGKRIFYPEYSSGFINPSVIYYLDGEGIIPFDNGLQNIFPFTDFIDIENNILLLTRHYLYKISFDKEIIFRIDLNKIIFDYKYAKPFFYKLLINKENAYLLERRISNKIHKILIKNTF